MAEVTKQVRLQLIVQTTAEWASETRVPKKGEPCFEISGPAIIS